MVRTGMGAPLRASLARRDRSEATAAFTAGHPRTPRINSISPLCSWRMACDISLRRGSPASRAASSAMAIAPWWWIDISRTNSGSNAPGSTLETNDLDRADPLYGASESLVGLRNDRRRRG